MGNERIRRRLAAILAADVVAYSRLIEGDEEGTRASLRGLHAELLNPRISDSGGRIIKTLGDGILVEFASAVDAVRCALEFQRAVRHYNAHIPEDSRIEFRIGVNVGDVIVEGDDLHGNGVNVASRLEALCGPGDVYVSGAVYEHVAGKVMASFEDLGERTVKNITKPVRVYRVLEAGQKTEPSSHSGVPQTLPEKPSVAVLPFNNMSGELEQEYFSDGMAEEIITALSRLPWFHTIARNSSFAYKGKIIDVRQAGRDLGARYVLEGSVRKAGTRVRVAVQLIETESRGHLWADRFDGSIEDIFEVQDKISASVVGAIIPSLQNAEIVRARSLRTDNLSAYDNYLRSLPYYRSHTLDGFGKALKFLDKARQLDPEFALATALAALCMYRPIGGAWAPWSDTVVETAVDLARQALVVGKNDPLIMVYAATVLAFGGREFDLALTLLDDALEVAPYHAEVLERAGWIEIWCGELDRAIEHLQYARQLGPKNPGMHDILNGLAAAQLYAGRYAAAAAWAHKAHAQKPDFAVALRYLAASLAQLDRLEEANITIKRLLLIQPNCTISMMRELSAHMAKDPSMIEPYITGLRMAGLPE